MQEICSTAGIADPLHPNQGLGDLKSAGFEWVMLDLGRYCTEEMLEKGEIPSGALKRNFGAVCNGFRQKNIRTMAVIAPYLKRSTKCMDMSDLLLQIGKDSIRAAEALGCETIIIRPLFAGVAAGSEWEKNREYYLELSKACEKESTYILLQNQCKDLNGHMVRGICSDGETAAEWVEKLNKEAGRECFGFCLDVGACNLCGQDMNEIILALGSHLKAVLLRDSNGTEDTAMLPFTALCEKRSGTDWLSLLRGLRKIGYDGQMILDFSDTAESFSPILRPVLLKLAREILRYFRWQIELENTLKKYKQIVLFGAGNMCRNFMECYGKNYQPLFTCDNNSASWGSTFAGLTVKAPEALRELPEDCGVFICNTYYREIEEQLRSLGIKNIEYFNDEYLPSFPFDRLERR